MAITLLALSFAVVISFPITAGYRLWLSPLSDIPGPFFARCSILWKLWHVWNDTYRFAIRDAHEEYGQFVRITHYEVSVCNDEAQKKILVPLYDKSSWYKIFAMPDSSFVNQMSEVRAHKYSETRKKVAPGYSLNTILKNEGHIDEQISLFHCMVEKFSKDTGKISLPDCLTFFAFDLIGIVTFSGDFGFLKAQKDIDGHVANSEQLCKYLSIFGFFPAVSDYLSWYLGPVLAWLDIEPMKHVVKTTKACLARRSDDVHKDSDQVDRDMVSSWCAYEGSAPLTEKQIFAACLGNVAAGGDTVGGMAQAVMYYILRNPDVKVKLQAELREAQAANSLSSPAQYSETLNLPYFQVCLKEAYRVHPLVVTGMARVAPAQGVEIDGQLFPGGTVLNVNQWALHYSKEIYGEDAYEFKPERWFKPDTIAMDKYLIPFGSGYMTCPGRHLATVEMSKLLITLFLEYDICLVDPDKDWYIHESVLTKASGWEVTMERLPKRELGVVP